MRVPRVAPEPRTRGRTATATAAPPDGEKLHKVLARAGLGSRRELEQWIEQGRVTVNGKAATVGDRVGPTAAIRVDGRPVTVVPAAQRRARVLRYHKPVGEVCTRRDPEGRPTVFERLPSMRGRRWIAVGRLDASTSGLLLFTDDGELSTGGFQPRGFERGIKIAVCRQLNCQRSGDFAYRYKIGAHPKLITGKPDAVENIYCRSGIAVAECCIFEAQLQAAVRREIIRTVLLLQTRCFDQAQLIGE
jgi:hypothetical protein